MSAFLAHLAGIALGETARGAARPSLPPRYARPAASDVGFDAALIETSPDGRPLAPAPAATERRPRADGKAAEAAPAPFVAAPAERRTSPQSAAPGDPYPRPPAAESPPAAPRSAPAAAAAATRSPIAPPVSLELRNIAADPLSPLSPPASATAGPGEIGVADAAPNAPPFSSPQATAPAAAARARPSAPLSERALAGRMERPRPADPVIHVTIDRIDVRAPAVPRPSPAARRPSAEPSVSLSEFLRGDPRTRQ